MQRYYLTGNLQNKITFFGAKMILVQLRLLYHKTFRHTRHIGLIRQLSHSHIIGETLGATNMGHITDPPQPPPQGMGAVRLSHKSYKPYKFHNTIAAKKIPERP